MSISVTALGFKYPEHVHHVLEWRSAKDTFAISVDTTGLCPQCCYSISELRKRGFIVQLDRAWMNGREVYVYLFTPKGIALCEAEGID
jgi:hypothetical protein